MKIAKNISIAVFGTFFIPVFVLYILFSLVLVSIPYPETRQEREREISRMIIGPSEFRTKVSKKGILGSFGIKRWTRWEQINLTILEMVRSGKLVKTRFFNDRLRLSDEGLKLLGDIETKK